MSKEKTKFNNRVFYFIGLLILFLNKIRHAIQGYKNPRPFSVTEYERAINYDFSVVDGWLKALQKYSPYDFSVSDKTVLELGPGADLGAGLILLSRGAKKYNALDVNNLVKTVPDVFYEKLFSRLEKIHESDVDVKFLRGQLLRFKEGRNDKLNYVCRSDFDLSIFKNNRADLVFSQAAFEHFDNAEAAIRGLGNAVKPGTILVAEVDLQTHTRWLCSKDPLNIYRYGDLAYKLFRFSGSPNRVRPGEYKKILENNGWTNVKIMPIIMADKRYFFEVKNHLNTKFKNENAQMDYLSILICARKK